MTTAQAAAYLGIGARRCQQLIKGGKLKATWHEGQLYIDETDLADFATKPRPSGRPTKHSNK